VYLHKEKYTTDSRRSYMIYTLAQYANFPLPDSLYFT